MSEITSFRLRDDVKELLDQYMKICPFVSKSQLINWALYIYLSDTLKQYPLLYLEKDS